MQQTRRKFIASMAVAGASIPFVSKIESFLPVSEINKMQVRLFSKPLDSYDFDFLCECVERSGIGGIDLTVRPGGKVEPSSVETSLPKLITEAKKFNLALDMMVTSIVSVSDPFTERVIKTASESGIKYYRLGWFKYDTKGDIWEPIRCTSCYGGRS